MNGPARLVICSAIVLCAAGAAHAQTMLLPVPAPLVTAETEHWYQTAEPLEYAGSVYYPLGTPVPFNGNVMVRSGQYKGVPLYTAMATDLLGIVFVPLPGGFMHPYQRRIPEELVGTSGSTAPLFPVAIPAAIAPGMVAVVMFPEAAMTPTLGSPIAFDRAIARPSAALTMTAAAASPTRAPLAASASPVGASGRVAPVAARKVAARRPHAENGVFIEFDDARWFSSGPAVLFDARTFKRIGELHGLPVYTASGRRGTIFVSVAEGLDLVAPYSKRDK